MSEDYDDKLKMLEAYLLEKRNKSKTNEWTKWDILMAIATVLQISFWLIYFFK